MVTILAVLNLRKVDIEYNVLNESVGIQDHVRLLLVALFLLKLILRVSHQGVYNY